VGSNNESGFGSTTSSPSSSQRRQDPSSVTSTGSGRHKPRQQRPTNLDASRSKTPTVRNAQSHHSIDDDNSNNNKEHPIRDDDDDDDEPNGISNNSSMGATRSAAVKTRLMAMTKVYGPHANIYTDVLNIPPTSTTSQIREAFFCMRYDIYQKLDGPNPAVGLERKKIEARMNAINAGFQILSDTGRRKTYDASLLMNGGGGGAAAAADADAVGAIDTSVDTADTDSMGFPVSGGDGPSRNKTPFGRTGAAKARGSSFKLSPSKSDNKNNRGNESGSEVGHDGDIGGAGDRGHFPIGQRRSVFRRRAARNGSTPTREGASTGGTKKSGMNESRKIVAEPVTGGLNTRKALSPIPDCDSGEGFDGAERAGAGTLAGALAGTAQQGRTDGNGSDGVFGPSLAKTDGIFTDSTVSGRKEPNWADFGNDASNTGVEGNGGVFGQEGHDQVQGGFNINNINDMGNTWSAVPVDDEQSLPAGVNNLNVREQMLYKNQMYLSQQKRQAQHWQQQQKQQQQQNAEGCPVKGTKDRLGSRYDNHDRGDKYTIEEPLASPTGVDGLDQESNNDKWSQSIRKPSSSATTDSNITDDQEEDTNFSYAQNTASVTEVTSFTGDSSTVKEEVGERPEQDDETRASSMYDDDTRTYDDDTRTYGDETQTYGETASYEDESATLGTATVDDGTIDESTWASECDASSYASTRYGDSGGKYSPKHKKGTKPMPILKSGKGGRSGDLKRADSDVTGAGGRRVTIHSHRGRGGESDDFTLFDGASCPIPSFTEIQEEVTGTYKDFTSALHQVSNAFVISPDDIDRMADKIRDAKIELGENYYNQIKDWQQVKGGSG